MKTGSLRIGLFGIGLEAYWPQFAGLKPRLEGYLSRVAVQLGRPGVEVVSVGLVDNPDRAYAAASEFRRQDVAVLQMSRYLAVHYGPAGIRFNCISPGPFPNPGVQKGHPGLIQDLNRKTALNRIGHNQEIVGPTLFLLTDSASYVTGHNLVVDGGWTSW